MSSSISSNISSRNVSIIKIFVHIEYFYLYLYNINEEKCGQKSTYIKTKMTLRHSYYLCLYMVEVLVVFHNLYMV